MLIIDKAVSNYALVEGLVDKVPFKTLELQAKSRAGYYKVIEKAKFEQMQVPEVK